MGSSALNSDSSGDFRFSAFLIASISLLSPLHYGRVLMSPCRGLERRNTVRIFLFELLRQLTQHRVIVSRFVIANTLPIERLRSSFCVSITLEHRSIPTF